MSKEEFESISKETYVLGMARKEKIINDLVFLYENCNILNNECVRGIIDKTIKSIKHEFEEHLKLKEKVDSIQYLLDNKPYEFEELEVGIFIYDKLLKCNGIVRSCLIEKCINGKRFVQYTYVDKCGDIKERTEEFKPDRFYLSHGGQ